MAKAKDLTGQKFGKLTALEKLPECVRNGYLWLCQCDCGNTKVVPSGDLTQGRVKSCGCLKHNHKDFTGLRRGKLTGVRPTGEFDSTGHRIFLWRCDCGTLLEKSVHTVTTPNRVYMCSECRKKYNREQASEMRVKLLAQTDPEMGLTEKSVDNILNGVLTASNTSGVRGVYWHKTKKKWIATGRKDGRLFEIGKFDNKADAAEARERFVQLMYFKRQK